MLGFEVFVRGQLRVFLIALVVCNRGIAYVSFSLLPSVVQHSLNCPRDGH